MAGNTAGAGTAPETWSEKAKISISLEGGDEILFGSLTETIDIDLGDKDIEAIATTSGGRLVKYTPQDITTVTLEAYPLEAGTLTGAAANTDGTGFFGMMNTEDATEPLDVDVDRVRSKHRIAIMWTDSVSITTANAQVGTGTYCMRVVASDGYFTSVKPSYTDGILKFTVTYKVPPFDSSGTANIAIQSTDASATLTALQSYTVTTKW